MGRDLKLSIRKCRQVLPAILLAFTLLLSGCGAETTSSQMPQSETNAPASLISDGGPVSEIEHEQPVKESSVKSEIEPVSETSLPAALPEASTFLVRFIDVGQADAALVECDGHYMLIDGGNKADSSVLYTVLKNGGVRHLDLVVGTHAHEDHIGGIPGAFQYSDAGLTLCPVKSYDSEAFEDFAKYAAEKGGGITVPSVGDTYPLGSAEVSILGVNGGSDTNDTSIILKVQYGETSFLFTGDAEREAEQAVLNTGADLSATVLKVGHHGSETSTTYPFLREIMPAYAVISVGKDNSYGHPTDDVLSRLRDAEAEVYRTDLQGDIIFTSNGKTVTVSTAKNVGKDILMAPGSSAEKPQTPSAAEVQPEQPAPELQQKPAETDYIINVNTGKFHYPDCSSVKRMKESNKRFYTGSRDELIVQGYSPCGNCHP